MRENFNLHSNLKRYSNSLHLDTITHIYVQSSESPSVSAAEIVAGTGNTRLELKKKKKRLKNQKILEERVCLHFLNRTFYFSLIADIRYHVNFTCTI